MWRLQASLLVMLLISAALVTQAFAFTWGSHSRQSYYHHHHGTHHHHQRSAGLTWASASSSLTPPGGGGGGGGDKNKYNALRHTEITATQRKQAAALYEDPRLLTHHRLNEIFRPLVDYNDYVIRYGEDPVPFGVGGKGEVCHPWVVIP